MRKPLTLAAALLFALSLQAAEPTVEEILAKNTAARGGAAKLAAVKSMRFSGKLSVAGMEGPITMLKKRPEMLKVDFSIGGMNGTQAFDGTSGWMVMPMMGKPDAEAIDGEMLKAFKDQADFDGPFIDYAKKGNKVELLGKVDVDGAPAYKLKLTSKEGLETTVYLDAATFLEKKLETKRKMMGQEIDAETTLSNYKDVEGLQIAFTIDSRPKGAPAGQTFLFDKVEINPTVDDATFKMPAAKQPTEAVKQ